MKRAAPIVLSAPSGTGKTTLAHRLIEESDNCVFSVSITTRTPRQGEQHGLDYVFVDGDRFDKMIESGDLAEWAYVHGGRYGTPKKALNDAADLGQQVVLDIDVQGALQIRDAIPDAKLIFVLPPSVDVLLERLRIRGTEESEVLGLRLRSALEELEVALDFDYIIINEHLSDCVQEIRDIIEGKETVGLNSEAIESIEVCRAGITSILERDYQKVI
ncbi:MAG: guanylate kinase [Gemmatimonadota bacterium]|jgi:guanylate kinase|nr:guanylate kinase [Gemmatimonadota bacterium]MEC7807707.1 guanylate kinase [Gemmatimonadota bacterium]MEC9317120.1 guanylate kinase [Gemmatimonadota bacterium]HCK34011.1 guanylate kinase [Gemmatimonadota bacterium]|tara:strand:- start:3194 stop:3844 length:651 start_codon:yes stop_codon:yes gene_type:complete